MTTNATAPTSDVTTPMESSIGLSSVRAIRSASSRKIAPANIEVGSSRLWFGPAIIRAACGTTSPTNPMLPLTDTHTPISTDTVTSTASFTRRTFTPTCRALSSPMANAFSSRAWRTITPPQSSSASDRIRVCG